MSECPVRPAGGATSQAVFAHALLDASAPVPRGLVGPRGLPCERRFAVYRNNVVVGLTEALQAAFPVVHRLVGDAFFSAMARLHVTRTPPPSPVMLDHGGAFPAFIADFAPAAALPYLADVARLERAWVEAYHAAEAVPIAHAALASVRPEALPASVLILHPTVRLVRSAHPILRIWQANTEGQDADPSDIGPLTWNGDDVLVSRAHAEVELRRLPPGAAAFIDAVLTGRPMDEATQIGVDASERFDLARALIGLIEAGAIVGVTGQPINRRPIAAQRDATAHPTGDHS